jgi:hypothetical protein
MRRQVWIGAVFVAMLAGGRGLGADGGCCEPSEDGALRRLSHTGCWHPYGGGLLRWWPTHCFPCGGAPDDYCRKPLPKVCWPPYPSYYIWGPREICYPQSSCGRACDKPH